MTPSPTAASLPPTGYLATRGAQIIDSRGNVVRISAVNWQGAEYCGSPQGIWDHSIDEILQLVADSGFNAIRYTYSDAVFAASVDADRCGINFQKNPRLENASPLDVLDEVVAAARRHHLRIILDRHGAVLRQKSCLWYAGKRPQGEAKWLDQLRTLASRYRGNPTVGIDLTNEPCGQATWEPGGANPDFNWRYAAERGGNEVLAANPNLLVIIEGVEHYAGDTTWQGSHLGGVATAPIRLAVAGRLVYSVHEYAHSLWPTAPWLTSPQFPENLPDVWDRRFGYVLKNASIAAPIFVGEFGGLSMADPSTPEGKWARTFLGYLQQNGFSWALWALGDRKWNPDVGGLTEDYLTISEPAKLALLRPYQAPKIE
jgi:endoglucanase